MSIKIIEEPDVHVTEGELRRYRDEYRRSYMHYVGTPPTLEEFIRYRRAQQARAKIRRQQAAE